MQFVHAFETEITNVSRPYVTDRKTRDEENSLRCAVRRKANDKPIAQKRFS